MRIMLLSLPGIEEADGYLFPLGVGYLAAMLRPSHEVTARHYQTMKGAAQDVPRSIEKFKPDLVGLTCNTSTAASSGG